MAEAFVNHSSGRSPAVSDDNNRPTTFTQVIHYLVRLVQTSDADRFVPI